VHFEKGVPVEVTWFADVTSENERRIVKLMIGRDANLKHTELSKGETTD
jgi:(2Fe-2S) ferredoxin